MPGLPQRLDVDPLHVDLDAVAEDAAEGCVRMWAGIGIRGVKGDVVQVREPLTKWLGLQGVPESSVVRGDVFDSHLGAFELLRW